MLSRDGRLLTARSEQQISPGTLLYDLTTKTARREVGHASTSFVQTSTGEEWQFVWQSKRATSFDWSAILGPWWTRSGEDSTTHELSFRNPANGNLVDRWQCTAKRLRLHILPQGNRLLLHSRLEDGLERLELYSLPPRRPWFHIFGWAFAAGITMELLGLGGRWWRRRKVQP